MPNSFDETPQRIDRKARAAALEAHEAIGKRPNREFGIYTNHRKIFPQSVVQSDDIRRLFYRIVSSGAGSGAV